MKKYTITRKKFIRLSAKISLTALAAWYGVGNIIKLKAGDDLVQKSNQPRLRKFNPKLSFINKNFRGNPVDNDGLFYNSPKRKQTGFFDIMAWKFSTNPQQKKKEQENYNLTVINDTSFLTSKEDVIVWLGHASFFIRMNGFTLLTDPVFGKAAVVPRAAGIACSVAEFKNIDYLLISHNHRDHLELDTVEILYKNNPKIHALLPLGVYSDIECVAKGIRYTEACWFQRFNTKDGISIDFLPAYHWSRRWLTDGNRSLWGSFMISGKKTNFYFAGDTAYGSHFTQIKQLYPKIDFAAIAIGAYRPSSIMKHSHTTPEEAFQAFQDLEALHFIPMHYGTYDLADEPLGEPITRLYAVAEKNKTSEQIKQMSIGGTISV